MDGFYLWHWMIVLIIVVPSIWASVRILHRIGLSGWWIIIGFIPLGNIIGLILLACVRWPVEDNKVHTTF